MTILAVFSVKTESTAASSIGKIPVSCGDLHQIGHKKSGLYSVMGSKQVENVYCDFTKPTGDAGKIMAVLFRTAQRFITLDDAI